MTRAVVEAAAAGVLLSLALVLAPWPKLIATVLRRGSRVGAGADRDRRTQRRLEAAGLAQALTVDSLVIIKIASSISLAASAALYESSNRNGFIPRPTLLLALATVGGWLVPELLVLRARLVRQRAVAAALPGLMAAIASGISIGLDPLDALSAATRHRDDPLSQQFAIACERIRHGEPLEQALAVVAEGFGDPRVGSLTAELVAARRRGGDARERVSALARAARATARRREVERAARAAPMIQLVVALGLVPSVLLLIAAVVVAHLAS